MVEVRILTPRFAKKPTFRPNNIDLVDDRGAYISNLFVGGSTSPAYIRGDRARIIYRSCSR